VIKVGRLSTKCALHHQPGIQMVKDPGGETQKMLTCTLLTKKGTIFLA
jgi:hypothetical protein